LKLCFTMIFLTWLPAPTGVRLPADRAVLAKPPKQLHPLLLCDQTLPDPPQVGQGSLFMTWLSGSL
jgi:hypothetical protein